MAPPAERQNWKQQMFSTARGERPPERNDIPPKPAEAGRARTPDAIRRLRRAAAGNSHNHPAGDFPVSRGDEGAREEGGEGKVAEKKEGEKQKEPELDEETKARMRKEHGEVVRQLKENGNEYLELYLPPEARKPPPKESVVRDIFEKKCITPAKVSFYCTSHAVRIEIFA